MDDVAGFAFIFVIVCLVLGFFGGTFYKVYHKDTEQTELQKIQTTNTCKVIRYLPCNNKENICEIETREPCEVK